jgi:Family of unknown function (DUF5320)
MGYGQGNNWHGRGPFSHLPPWQRPGHLYGRGACWYMYGGPSIATVPVNAEDEATLLAQQKNVIEEQIKAMQATLDKIQARLSQIKQ